MKPEPSDIAKGWHIIRDGNAWCAVGLNLKTSWSARRDGVAIPKEARDALAKRFRRGEVVVPPLVEFRIWTSSASDARIGSMIDGSSFAGLLTRVEIGHMRSRSDGNGRSKSRGSDSSLSYRA
jgi:hypothetical protein